MPRRPGMRDDDLLARLADIERRLDSLEAGPGDAAKGKKDSKSSARASQE